MINWDALIEEVNRDRKAGKPKKQFTLGMLIAALERVPNSSADARYDFGYLYPTTFDSYRGYYDDLALGYEDGGRRGKYPTAEELLAAAKDADGSVFQGWKGGNYRMDRDTMLWVANRGCAGDTIIVGVDADEYDVILRTEMIDG